MGEAEKARLPEDDASSILESIADGFYALDRDWRFTLFNDQCERYFGLKRANVLGRTYFDVFPAARNTVFHRALETALVTGESQSAEAASPVTGVPILLRAFPSQHGLTVVFTDVSARTKTDEALRRSEDRYRSLFESLQEGFCVFEVLFEGDHAVDYRFLEVNPAFERHTGLSDVVGKTMRSIAPLHEEHWFQLYGGVARTGQPMRMENYAEQLGRWFDVSAFRVGAPGENRVGVLFSDISDRKLAVATLIALERQQSFLLALGDRLRPLTDPLAVTTAASEELGRHLNVSRVGYGEIDPTQQIVSVERDWTNGEVASLAGESRPLDVFGPDIIAILRRGETLRLDDIAADPVAAPYAEGYASIGTRSLLIVPLVKEGVFRAILYLHEPAPRHWTDREAELAREVAERTWAAVESSRAQADLRKSEKRFEAIANSIDQMIWSTRPDGYHDYYNRRWYEYTGMPLGSTDGAEWNGMFHPDDQERAWAIWRRCLETGEPYHIEYRLRHRSGQYRWVIGRALPIRNAAGEIERWYGTCTDVHDLKTAQEQFRKSQERLALALGIAGIGTFDIDLLTDAVVVNERGREIYGWSPETALSFAYVQSFFHPHDRAWVLERVAEAFAPRGPGEFEVEQRIIRSDGEERWIRVRGRAIFEGEQAVRCIGTYLDVTEARKYQETLKALNEGLEQRVAERTRELQEAVAESEGFNYSISHDLRAPLRAIVATASILLEEMGPEIESEYREMLKRQALNAKRLGTLIDELLRLSRLARAEVNCVPLDMTAKARDVAAIELADRQSELSVEVQEGMTAEGDPNLVRTLLHNLIGNAIKFSPHGGTVRVRQQDGVFSVSDEGVGFDMKYVHKIFRPFERLVLESEFPGTGIGLANVERIVRRHGGRVWAESELGKGSTFYFTLGSGEPDAVPGFSHLEP
ncbi:PAS domain S-box protein [bacterium]|nr:MAG: PAS domain S-box protein [bacterium]